MTHTATEKLQLEVHIKNSMESILVNKYRTKFNQAPKGN